EESVRKKEDLLEAFLQHIPAAACVRDSSGKLVFQNRTFRRLFQQKVEKAEAPPTSAPHIALGTSGGGDLDTEDAIAGKTRAGIEVVRMTDGALHQWYSLRFPFLDSLNNSLAGWMAFDSTHWEGSEDESRTAQDLRRNAPASERK